MINYLTESHKKIFQKEPLRFYFSPGRVNLIGEHIDYSGGYVLPVALSIGTYASVSKRDDGHIQVYSENFPKMGILSIHKNDLSYKKEDGYISYIKGMIYKLIEQGYQIDLGLNIFIYGNLPTGAGLSSSASLELLISKIFEKEHQINIELLNHVLYAKYVENEYLGLSSGIMDQFAIAYGKKNHALFLNTRTLSFQHIPISFENHTLILMNTNKSRSLVESNYNERVESTQKSYQHFKTLLAINSLCDMKSSDLEKYHHTLKDMLILKRTKHVVLENERTIQAAEALKKNDFKTLGQLMTQSHQSLKTLFEVSCNELDYLVNYHLKQGALGARMTGAGFGGTMIALYENHKVPKSFNDLKKAYHQTFNRQLDIIFAKSDDGTRVLKGDF